VNILVLLLRLFSSVSEGRDGKRKREDQGKCCTHDGGQAPVGANTCLPVTQADSPLSCC